MNTHFVQIKSKYENSCLFCETITEKGATIYWKKNTGVCCLDCFNKDMIRGVNDYETQDIESNQPTVVDKDSKEIDIIGIASRLIDLKTRIKNSYQEMDELKKVIKMHIQTNDIDKFDIKTEYGSVKLLKVECNEVESYAVKEMVVKNKLNYEEYKNWFVRSYSLTKEGKIELKARNEVLQSCITIKKQERWLIFENGGNNNE